MGLRHSFSACVFVLGISFAASAVAETPTTATQAKPTVGAEAPHFQAMASKTASSALTFFACLLLGIGLAKRFIGKKKNSTEELVKIISRQSVTPKTSLLLAEIEGRKLLLALNGDAIELLTELKPQTAVAEASAPLQFPSLQKSVEQLLAVGGSH